MLDSSFIVIGSNMSIIMRCLMANTMPKGMPYDKIIKLRRTSRSKVKTRRDKLNVTYVQ